MVDSAELEAREIADRLGIDFAGLKERAQRNAEVEDWGILKQARFEAIILQEQARQFAHTSFADRSVWLRRNAASLTC